MLDTSPYSPGVPLTPDTPYTSVVVPVYNRVDLLCRCLSSLAAQTYPAARFEIIVVDDGSTEEVAGPAHEAVRGWGGRFRVVRKSNGGPASARNAGIQAATGEIIAFTDADCEADRSWLATLVTTLESGSASGVGGPIANISPPGWIARYLSCVNFYRHRVRHGTVDYLLTASAAYRRSALQWAGGFHEEPGVWGEDADLSFRLIRSGHRLLLAQEGPVRHYGAPVSLAGWARELYRYGKGNAVLSRNWSNGRSPLVEFIRHGGAVVLAPLLALRQWRCAGMKWAISFYPLIVVEHGAFMLGLVRGTMRSKVRKTDTNLDETVLGP